MAAKRKPPTAKAKRGRSSPEPPKKEAAPRTKTETPPTPGRPADASPRVALVYTPEEVATLLKLHPQTVYQYIRKGRIRAAKLGRVWRIRHRDLDDFLTRAVETSSVEAEEATPC